MVMEVETTLHVQPREATREVHAPPSQRRAPSSPAVATRSTDTARRRRLAVSVGATTSREAVARFRPWILDRLPLLLILGDVAALSSAALLTDARKSLVYVLALGAMSVFQARHLYRPRATLSLSDDLFGLCTGVIAGGGAGLLVARASGSDLAFGRVVVVTLVVGLMVVIVRAGLYGAIRAARRQGLVSHRAIIVGTDATAARLGATLEAHPEHGLRVAGYVGRVDETTPARVSDATLGPDPELLPVLTRQHDADIVLMTMCGVDDAHVLQMLRVWGPPGRLTVFMVPPLFQMLHGGAFDRIRDFVLIPIRTSVSRRLAWRFKTIFDATAAAVLLFLLAPVLLAVAAAVRWETGRGVLFKQTRIGLGGRPFTLYKFRSLRPASESESAQNWSVAHDDRLGPVGRFIRKSSLDELPQLLNILKGEMSLVGPRPERPFFVEQFGDTFDSYALRHRVRPGLTGWAAVNGLRGDTCIQERAYFDNVYIDNWSLQFDLKIIVLTALSVLKGTGA